MSPRSSSPGRQARSLPISPPGHHWQCMCSSSQAPCSAYWRGGYKATCRSHLIRWRNTCSRAMAPRQFIPDVQRQARGRWCDPTRAGKSIGAFPIPEPSRARGVADHTRQEVLHRWHLACHCRTMFSREKCRISGALPQAGRDVESTCLPSRCPFCLKYLGENSPRLQVG